MEAFAKCGHDQLCGRWLAKYKTKSSKEEANGRLNEGDVIQNLMRLWETGGRHSRDDKTREVELKIRHRLPK